MPRDEKIIGARSGRNESPEVELIMQEEIGGAIVSLITSKGLYQNTVISIKALGNYIESINSEYSVNDFEKEFSRRPWVPVTQDLPHGNYMRAQHFCGVNDVALGTPNDEMKLSFPLPSAKIYCSKCKDYNTFQSIGVLWADLVYGLLPNN